MRKAVKRIIAAVLIIALVCGGVIGGLFLYRHLNSKPVNVFLASDFAVTEYWGDSAETYGMVKADRMQTIFTSDAQPVKEVLVSEGQEVRIGDSLVQLDTTLSAINLEKAEIACTRLELQLKQAEKSLEKIKAMKPHATILVTPSQKNIVYKTHATPSIISGAGTSKDPYYCLWGKNDVLDEKLMNEFLNRAVKKEEPTAEESEAEGEGEVETEPKAPANGDIYVAFVTRSGNALNAPITNEWGLHISRRGGEISMQYYQPVLSSSIRAYEANPEPYYIETGSAYTSAELAKMKADKEKEIVDLTLQNKIAKVDLEKLRGETSDGIIRSTVDGIVKAVRDPATAETESRPVVEVSGGGGYYIDVSMSEMDLEKVSIGDEVQVNDWTSGMIYTGSVKSISEYPTNDGNAWSDGNNNVSFYPFTVFVDDTAALEESSYVSVIYNRTEKDTNGFYLENTFIRTEAGISYVYVKGEEGSLEKRTVQTGRSLWGSHTQIRGGIGPEDRVAFPYGKDVQEGAKTVDAEPDAFYSMN